MNCERFQELMDAYLEERLEGPVRITWREHLRECASCRELAVGREPTLMLATLSAREAGPEAVAACLSGTQSLIRQDRLVHRLRRRSKRWLAAAAAVLVLLAGGLAWRLRSGGVGAASGGVAAAASARVTTPAPEVEVEMPAEKVRVYQFATEGDDLAVTYIINPAMDL